MVTLDHLVENDLKVLQNVEATYFEKDMRVSIFIPPRLIEKVWCKLLLHLYSEQINIKDVAKRKKYVVNSRPRRLCWTVTGLGHNAVKSVESQSCLSLAFREFLARLILRPWRWKRYVPPKNWSTFNGLHGVISQTLKENCRCELRN
jgi:hypothetical protein